jgi:hypothetical protein
VNGGLLLSPAVRPGDNIVFDGNAFQVFDGFDSTVDGSHSVDVTTTSNTQGRLATLTVAATVDRVADVDIALENVASL